MKRLRALVSMAVAVIMVAAGMIWNALPHASKVLNNCL